MREYFELLLSIEELNRVPKDCIKMIIEYLYFKLKHVENMDIKHIKSSKYFKDFDTVLKNNIDVIIEKKPIKKFKLDNDNLHIITDEFIEIYKNNKLINSITHYNVGGLFTYKNNTIFTCYEFSDIMKSENILHISERKSWLISDLCKYMGCLSIASHNGKIYLIAYNLKKVDKIYYNYNYDLNIYNESGLLLKSQNIFNERNGYKGTFSLNVNDDMIFIQFFNFIDDNKFINVYEKFFIYDNDIDLICSVDEYDNLSTRLGIIKTNNNIISVNKNCVKIYEYEKIKL